MKVTRMKVRRLTGMGYFEGYRRGYMRGLLVGLAFMGATLAGAVMVWVW